jgi:hypothetical protein
MNPWMQAEYDFWLCVGIISTVAVVGIVCQIVSIAREERRTRLILMKNRH